MLKAFEENGKGWIIILGIPALFLCAYVLFANPSLLNLPICAVKSFLHVDCPGCGLTHSFAYLIHGKIRQSIDYHPLGIFIALWFLYEFLRVVLAQIFRRPLPILLSQRGRDIVLIGFLIGMFGQWLAKILIILGR